MRKLLFLLLAAFAIAAAAGACGGDDDDGVSPTGGGSPSQASPARTGEAEETPANGDLKTPVGETPEEGTPEPTSPGPRPTPAAEGTPATLIEDANAFFASNYPGKSPVESDCGFNPVTVLVTCGAGKYAVDPPLTGQDITCALLSVDDTPVAIRCTSQEPLQSIYYDIQE